MQEVNARIISTMLGIEDHGIMTFYLHLDYGGRQQGFGGYRLDDRGKGTVFGLQSILEVLRVTGVSEWEKLLGTPVRVRTTESRIKMLGHYLNDTWLDLDALAVEYGRD